LFLALGPYTPEGIKQIIIIIQHLYSAVKSEDADALKEAKHR